VQRPSLDGILCPRRAHLYEVKYSALYYTKLKGFKERAIIIDIPGFLKDYAGVISALVAVTNLYFVSQVFKFNRRMSQSKLSISHIFDNDDEFTRALLSSNPSEVPSYEIDNTYFQGDLTWIEPRFGLPSATLLKVEAMKTLSVRVKNNGELPSTNVKVKLIFKAYGTVNFYPREGEEFTELLPREVFFERDINIIIPYIGADEERVFQICKLHGQFREAELHLMQIKANGFEYIKPNLFKNLFSKEDTEIILHHYKCSILKLRRIPEIDLKNLYGLTTDFDDVP